MGGGDIGATGGGGSRTSGQIIEEVESSKPILVWLWEYRSAFLSGLQLRGQAEVRLDAVVE